MSALVQVFIDIAVNIGKADKVVVPVILQDAVKVLIKTTLICRQINKGSNKPEQEELEYFVS